MGDLIERKLLFQFVRRDSLFSIDSPERYTNCVAEWQKSIRFKPHFFTSEKSTERLKSLLCEKDILEQYFKERIESNIQVSEEEMRLYFDQNKQEFADQARVVIRQVLLASENDAKRVRSKLNSANFASLVKEYSIAPEASSGGIIGPFAKGEMPSLFDIAFEMNVGEIQGIIKSPYGFHIIMLEKKLPRTSPVFENAKSRIFSAVMKKKKEEEYTKWVEIALNSIPIKSSRGL
jgi:parvulin-like peptidyl-prolyl isomerase